MRETAFSALTLNQGRLALERLTLSVRDLQAPHVVVAPVLMGVCSADLRELRGERHSQSTFGHELVGHVVACGGGVRHRVGDLVVHNPNVPVRRSSGFAELFVTESHDPHALSDAFHAAPRDITWDALIFAEPLAAAVRCVRKLQEHARDAGVTLGRIGILGVGVFGLLIALEARARGLEVVLLNRSEPRIAFARAASPRLAAIQFQRLGNDPGGFDAIVLATTEINPQTWATGAALARSEGLVHLFGATRPGLTWTGAAQDLDMIRRDELCVWLGTGKLGVWISGSRGADRNDMATAMVRLRASEWRETVQGLIVDRVDLPALGARLISLAHAPYFGRLVLDLAGGVG